jgi:hypothetical protein
VTCDPQHPRAGARARALLVLLLGALFGCRCGGLSEEVDGHTFTRCAQIDPPAERSFKSGALELTIRGRTLVVSGARGARIAAFTGPVGALLEPADLLQLTAARPTLALYLGGLGDSAEIAGQNLRRLAALQVPTLFIAGGADRLSVIEAAFARLSETERSFVLHASGLRELQLGQDRFVVVSGAPFGRYAVDEQACGFGARDLAVIQEELSALRGASAGRVWLLSWHAPAGLGITAGYAGSELGSPDLKALALALGARGGLFAYPETHAGESRGSASEQSGEQLAHVVPRLGRVGVERADGSRVGSSVLTLLLSERGPVRAP